MLAFFKTEDDVAGGDGLMLGLWMTFPELMPPLPEEESLVL